MLRSINRSITGAFVAALVLAASAIVFAQTPSDTVTAVKTEKPRTFTTIAKFTPDTATTKETVEAVETPIVKPSQAATAKSWEFGAAMYLYLSSLSGTVGANGRTATIDQSIGDVLSHFKAGFMGTFSARHKRFVSYNDLIWVKLTEETATPGGLYNTGKVSVNMTIFNPQAGIRVAEGKAGFFDILGGLRVTSQKPILSFTSGRLPGFTAEARKTWAAPTIGGHGLMNLSPKVYLSTFFDVGGGWGTHVTGQFYGGMGYRVKPNMAMIFGYRYLKNDYNDDAGFVSNTTMNGLMIGANFKF